MFAYDTEEKIMELVRSFEDASISRGDWHHAEHLIVALYFVSRFDLDTAIEKMRNGILNLLVRGFNVDLAIEMPYHETLTVFWMRTAADFYSAKASETISDIAEEFVSGFDKDHPLRYYSRDLLFSDDARVKFVSPNIHQK